MPPITPDAVLFGAPPSTNHEPDKGVMRDLLNQMIADTDVLRGVLQAQIEIYPNTAAGLAGVSEGEQFWVESSDPDVAVYVYRRDSGPVATLLVEWPTVSALGDKAAAIHDHSVTDLSDSTAAGRALLTAENVAAQLAALGLGTAAAAATTDFATAAQGAKADSAIQPGNSALSDSREWTATTVDQAEAEAGTATTRRAWTSLRVRQAVAAWWAASSAKTALDAATAAIGSLSAVASSGAYADLTGRPTLGTAAGASTTDFATAAQGAKADSAIQPGNSALSDSREWTATTVDQAEAEAGTATTRRAWTALRVRQAVAAWWAASSAKAALDAATAAIVSLSTSLATLTTRVDRIAINDVARPGENPEQFSSTLTGEPEARPVIAAGSAVVNSAIGHKVWRVTGADVDGGVGYVDVAPRRAYAMDLGRIYRVKVGFIRAVDPVDPEGNGVEVRVQNLNSNKASVSNVRIGDAYSPEVADGLTEVVFTVSRDLEADYTPPSTARYLVPYPRFHGVAQSTDAVFVSWDDITDISLGGADVASLTGRVSAAETALDGKAPINSPTFTGTVSGITKGMVGLGNVSNTAPADLPISTATQQALDDEATARRSIGEPVGGDMILQLDLGNGQVLDLIDAFGSLWLPRLDASVQDFLLALSAAVGSQAGEDHLFRVTGPDGETTLLQRADGGLLLPGLGSVTVQDILVPLRPMAGLLEVGATEHLHEFKNLDGDTVGLMRADGGLLLSGLGAETVQGHIGALRQGLDAFAFPFVSPEPSAPYLYVNDGPEAELITSYPTPLSQRVPGAAWIGARHFATWYINSRIANEGPGDEVILAYSDDDWVTSVVCARFSLNADDDETYRIFDPQLWVDPEGRLWIIYAVGGNGVHGDGIHGCWATICPDPRADHLRFTRPFRISQYGIPMRPTLIDGEWCLPIDYWVYTGPAFAAYAGKHLYRLDWRNRRAGRLSTLPASTGTASYDETQIVQLRTGQVLAAYRTTTGTEVNYSEDGGLTWGVGAPWAAIGDNPSSRIWLDYSPSGRLVLAYNNSVEPTRSHITLSLSEDDGVTWPYSVVLDARSGTSYPSVSFDDQGNITVVWDRDRTTVGEILAATVAEADVVAGTASPTIRTISSIL